MRSVCDTVLLWTALALALGLGQGQAADKSSRCVPVAFPACSEMYSQAQMPNMLGHNRSEDAGLEMNQFSPMVECSAHLWPLLCLVYQPPCSRRPAPLPPCRQLCQQVRDNCESFVLRYGFVWPEFLSCDRFPAAPGQCLDFRDGAVVVPPEPEPGCPGAAPEPAALDRTLASFLSRSERVYTLQEQNLLLEQRKLQLEIQLLETRLASPPPRRDGQNHGDADW